MEKNMENDMQDNMENWGYVVVYLSYCQQKAYGGAIRAGHRVSFYGFVSSLVIYALKRNAGPLNTWGKIDSSSYGDNAISH